MLPKANSADVTEIGDRSQMRKSDVPVHRMRGACQSRGAGESTPLDHLSFSPGAGVRTAPAAGFRGLDQGRGELGFWTHWYDEASLSAIVANQSSMPSSNLRAQSRRSCDPEAIPS